MSNTKISCVQKNERKLTLIPDLPPAADQFAHHGMLVHSEHSGPGLPNYLRGLAISPDGVTAQVCTYSASEGREEGVPILF